MKVGGVFAAAWLIGVVACGGGQTAAPESTPAPEEAEPVTSSDPTPDAAAPVLITARAELDAALGAKVRVTGTVQREKLGDSIAGDGFDVLCPDHRLPDEAVGTVVTVEGTLGRAATPKAEVAPDGAISQGTIDGASRWVLEACVLP